MYFQLQCVTKKNQYKILLCIQVKRSETDGRTKCTQKDRCVVFRIYIQCSNVNQCFVRYKISLKSVKNNEMNLSQGYEFVFLLKAEQACDFLLFCSTGKKVQFSIKSPSDNVVFYLSLFIYNHYNVMIVCPHLFQKQPERTSIKAEIDLCT